MSDFDDLFKSRMEGHEVEVPDDMWSRIQSAQAPEDTRKPIFFYWKTGIAVVVILSIISISVLYFTNDVDSEKHVLIDPPFSTSLADKLQSSSTDLGEVLKATSEELYNKLPFTKMDVGHVAFNQQSISTRDNELIKDAQFQQESKESQEKPIVGLPSNVTHKTSVAIAMNEAGSILSESASIRNTRKNSNSEELENFIPTLAMKYLTQDEVKKLLLFPDYDRKCPSFGNSIHGYFSVEAYHSSDYNLRTFTAVNEEFDAYASVRELTETSRYSYSNGVKFKWHNRSGLGVGAGIDRSVINETFSFVEQDAREVKILISIDTLFNSDGSFTTSSDTTRIELQGVRTNKILNSYTSVDIPLNLTYQIEMRKWAISFSGGIYVNVLFDQKGRILNFDNKPAWISSNSDNELDIYRTQSGVKFDGSIAVIYHLTTSIDIMAEPYFRYNPNSFTRENHPLKQYYSTAGIRTGLRYNFGF